MSTQEKTFLKEDLESFFKSRNLVKDSFNKKIDLLKKALREELDRNHENVIASVKFEGIKIFLSEQTKDNLFSGANYPETGLNLLSIEILHTEGVGSHEFKYYSNIIIRFNIKEDGYQNTWSEFSLSKLAWNDDKFRISEQSMGICLDPKFKEEDYFEVKKILSELKEKILNSIPKEAD